ncbi:MAG: M4 family metallopeptidase [Proteobacteria bacterium]|nr:M4 family metallopeptidase [Pseudomonadota bacterium]
MKPMIRYHEFPISLRLVVRVFGVLMLIVVATCGGGSSTDYVADTQASALDGLRAGSLTPVQFYFSDGIPEFLSMKVAVPSGLEDDAVVRALNFLETYKDLYGLTDPASQLYLEKVVQNAEEGEEHLFFGQRQNGIPVYGAALAVHIVDGYVRMTGGRYVADFPAYAAPSIDADAAEAAAIAGTGCSGMEALGETRLMYFDRALIDSAAESDVRLAWRVSLSGYCDINGGGSSWLAFVDACSGEALFYLSQSPAGKDFDIETANNTSSNHCWNGLAETDDDEWFDEDGPTGYPGAGSDLHLDGQHAYDYAHAVYDYFYNTFGRKGWDGHDVQAEIMVHALSSHGTHYDRGCDYILFIDGRAQRDILAHEWTHGIGSYEGVAEYHGESGALDEHFSDFFGAMVDGDWLMGEYAPGGAIRDMSDPPAIDNDPDHMDDYLVTSLDHGGVHTNCGIPNKASYLLAEGGVHNTYTIHGIGKDKAQRLYYKVLTDVLTGVKNFLLTRMYFVAVADIWAEKGTLGFSGQDVCDVMNAWGSVGVAEAWADKDCDGELDFADPDEDGDKSPDVDDNCSEIANPGQKDTDNDGAGDACDEDIDGDGKKNSEDNCIYIANSDQADADQDGQGDVCDDRDSDGHPDAADNCPDVANADQVDTDKDGSGNACDSDDDDDGVADELDNCPFTANQDQADPDGDLVGSACDNCPGVANPDQRNCDGDRGGTACDADEVPLPGDCGKVEFGVEMNRFVHPLDPVSLGDCAGCGNWLGQDFLIKVSVDMSAGGVAAYSAGIVDDLGHVVARGTNDPVQAMSFKPRAGFHYTAPGTQQAPFQAVKYFLKITPPEGAAMDGIDMDILVETQ